MTLTTTRIGTWLAPLAVNFLLVCHCSVVVSAQTPPQRSLPGVGTVKDYPATGLMTGCGNLYFYKAAQAKSTSANYVFLSRGDGSNAWMNLNGRDVRLQKIKSGAGQKEKSRRYLYHYGATRITVEFEGPSQGDAAGDDPMFRMKITLRNGGAVRVVKAVGDSDC
jgi:hypothetical protein